MQFYCLTQRVNYYILCLGLQQQAQRHTGLGGNMNTLTRFINPVFENDLDETKYEIIENEIIKSSNLEDLTISGSLFSLTTFTDVTFKSCVFFATRIENCSFVNCNFIDCKFEFSHISHSNFESCGFENCNWEFSSFKSSTLNHIKMDVRTNLEVNKGTNVQENCISIMPTNWQEAEALQESIETRVEMEETQNEWGTKLLNFLKTA